MSARLEAEPEGVSGAWMVEEAARWRRDNMAAWSAMRRIAEQFVAQGRRFSMETLIQVARYDMETRGFSQGFKVNNNLRSALARMLIDELPQARSYMDVRRSKADWWR